MTRITATEASRSFSDVLKRAQYRGESFEVTRGGEVVARIEPALPPHITLGEILHRIDRGPGLAPGDAVALEKEIAVQRREAELPESAWE